MQKGFVKSPESALLKVYNDTPLWFMAIEKNFHLKCQYYIIVVLLPEQILFTSNNCSSSSSPISRGVPQGSISGSTF